MAITRAFKVFHCALVLTLPALTSLAADSFRITTIRNDPQGSLTIDFEDSAPTPGNYQVMSRSAVDGTADWKAAEGARLTRVSDGCYSATLENANEGARFFRILSSTTAQPRLRKDVKDLTPAEAHDFVEAILRLKAVLSPYATNPPQYTYYDQFVVWHQISVLESHRVDYGIAHHNPAFLPWHRKLLLLYEEALSEVSGKEITLPYWDWTDPASTAAVFSEEFMGPGGEKDLGYAVMSGPFRKGVWQINVFPSNPEHQVQNPHPYLVRGLGDYSANSYRVLLPNAVDVANLLRVPMYDLPPYGMMSDTRYSFRNTLEGFVPPELKDQTLHNVVHDWVAGIFIFEGQTQVGTMEPLDTSPNDPVFFLHHANVDRLWAVWEAEHPNQYAPMSGGNYGWNFADEMFPFREEPYRANSRMSRHGLTPGSMLDTETLGYEYAD